MRILFETGSTCIGGAERVILRIAKGLRKKHPGWRMDAIVLCEHGGLEAEYREVFDNVFDPESDYSNSSWRIIGLVEKNKYDLVHCIDSFHLTSAAAKLLPATPFVQNVFPNVAKSPFGPTAEWMADTNLPYAALVTEFSENSYRLPRLPRGEIAVIANGIDTEFWCLPKTNRTNYRDIDVIWCARTDKEKGIDLALDIAPGLCGLGIRYVVVTSEDDGPKQRLRDLVREWRWFEHHSRLSPVELRSLFQRSRVFLSTSTVEGMPATPLEAAACGCRMLCAGVDGINDIFCDRPSYTYTFPAPPTRVTLLARIAHTFTTRNAAGSQDARQIALRYTLDAMVRSYDELYTSTVDRWLTK